MVAKQGWRLIQFPNSLVSKVLRARYFRSCSFLDAKPGSNPSFIWRSILWGRQVIQKGARWRIGNGSNILVYKENWIPRPDTFKPISPLTLPIDTTVGEVMDDENNWDVAKLNQHFMQEDTEAILKIPLPRSQKVDEMLWHYDKHGEYSVRSEYQIALKLKAPDEPSSSGSNSKRWKVVWSMELPEKMKIFMWRAARNLLPTAENLWKRKCLKDPICQGCNREVETVRHALLDCKAARKIWYHATSSVQIPNAQNQDILEFIYEVWSTWGKTEAEQAIAFCWAVWFARNKRIFEGKKSDPRASAAKAESLLEAYHRARKPDASHIHNVKRIVQKKWEPPPGNFLKVNVDAGINNRDQVAGLGAVIKDPSGKIVAADTKQVPLREGVSFAEAEAMEWGLQVAKELSLSALIMETDCKEVVDLLNNTKGSRIGISWVISDIQEQRRDFKEVKFRHIPRTCNTCAHSLTKLAVGANTSAVWLDHIPTEILNVLNSVV
ncbi:putative reverse transcriptase/RNA-dependent DNA polymerase [Citrus sinensis]|uniref:Reverse transcriptase/RNA-dependent DNA polymerase n=1 Tax=Citrus sinensis TaxID=2711 RepID=A0ACB8KJI2_CITSI|nr:putative reverse transcriptase/RNA-dependent DNA polymerase [Citrus sinensis]